MRGGMPGTEVGRKCVREMRPVVFAMRCCVLTLIGLNRIVEIATNIQIDQKVTNEVCNLTD